MGVELDPSYENMLSFSPNLGLKAMRRSRTLITRVLSPSYDQVMLLLVTLNIKNCNRCAWQAARSQRESPGLRTGDVLHPDERGLGSSVYKACSISVSSHAFRISPVRCEKKANLVSFNTMATRKLGLGVAARFPTTNARSGTLFPWRITGPVSHEEWKDVPVSAEDYRSSSPAETSAQAVTPHCGGSRVFHIRYFNRDGRRLLVDEGLFSQRVVNQNNLKEDMRLNTARHSVVNILTRATRVTLLDNTNAGFT